LTLSQLFLNIFETHAINAVNTYRLSDEAGKIFASFYNEMESEIGQMDDGGYEGYLQKKGFVGMLNKSSVS
jgi:hypothetical protein